MAGRLSKLSQLDRSSKKRTDMKKTILSLLIAAMTFSAVSCGKTDEPAAETETAAEVTEESTDDSNYEYTTSAEELEDVLNGIDEILPVFNSHAGINMKAEPMPETEPIPDDWHEVSNGLISFMVPQDVEFDSFEYDLGNGDTYKSTTAKSEDRRITIMFFDGNDWKAKAEEEDDGTDALKETFDDEAIEKIEEIYADKGYSDKVDINEEDTVRYMSELGLDYDGSRESLYRALFEFDESMQTDENEAAFEYIAQLKAEIIGMMYPGVYYMEAGGKPVYIHKYAGVYYDPSKEKKDGYKSVWIGAFASPDMEYTALVRGSDEAEALQIVSSMKIVG